MTDKQKAMLLVQQTCFALDEAVLFLDTHPTDKKAMEYFRRAQIKRDAAVADYEKRYGPLTAAATKSAEWNWIDNPWPWQIETEA